MHGFGVVVRTRGVQRLPNLIGMAPQERAHGVFAMPCTTRNNKFLHDDWKGCVGNDAVCENGYVTTILPSFYHLRIVDFEFTGDVRHGIALEIHRLDVHACIDEMLSQGRQVCPYNV